MIDPISNKAYQEYTRVSSQKPGSSQNEHFSLNTSVSEKENASGDAIYDGVMYDSAKTAKPSQEADKRNEGTDFSEIFEKIKKAFAAAGQAIKKIFRRIWETPPTDDVKTVEKYTESEPANKAEVNSSDGNSARVARSTSLLTRYDSHARIVTPDASDSQRILHGDKGLRK